VALDGAPQLMIFRKAPSLQPEEHAAAAAAAERLSALVIRSRIELASYPTFEPPAPAAVVEQRFWTPEEVLAGSNG